MPALVGFATLSASSFGESVDIEDVLWDEIDETDAAYNDFAVNPEDDAEEGPDELSLADLGAVDPQEVLEAIEAISERYLNDLESNLVWLMLEARRPVEISRILGIPECEVVRLRRNCFRKIRTVYLYDYHHDKKVFLKCVTALLELTPKQVRILTMFFDYYGLRQIAETIGTRASNIHRSLRSMRLKMEELLPENDELRFFLGAFKDFKYLCLTVRNEGAKA